MSEGLILDIGGDYGYVDWIRVSQVRDYPVESGMSVRGNSRNTDKCFWLYPALMAVTELATVMAS